MITLDDVKTHLGAAAAEWADETIAAVLHAEHAAQRSVTRPVSPRTPELDEALLRRVEHNLRATDGEPLVRIGIRADGVRDLERPWSLRRDPEPEDQPTPKTGQRRTRRGRKAASPAADSTAAPAAQTQDQE